MVRQVSQIILLTVAFPKRNVYVNDCRLLRMLGIVESTWAYGVVVSMFDLRLHYRAAPVTSV